MLKKLRTTEQSPFHHPEGNVWNHTLLVVDEAAARKAQSSDIRAFMWAALLHDIGKPSTTAERRGKITSYNHDTVGAKLVPEFLSKLTDDADFIERVSCLVRYHMQMLFVNNNLPFKDIEGMRRDTDIKEVALLGLCDRLGRSGAGRAEQEKEYERFMERCGVFINN